MISANFLEASDEKPGFSWTRFKTARPNDWKPMMNVGAGSFEIRVRDEAGAFRVIYVARFADTIYVLHAFQKKTEKTAQRDVALARVRYQQMLQGRNRP